MKKYQIITRNLLGALPVDLFLNEGFKILKVSEQQALNILPLQEQQFSSYADALQYYHFEHCTNLQEYEVYEGYIAIWKGNGFKSYYLRGYLSLATDTVLAHSFYQKEAITAGHFLSVTIVWADAENRCHSGSFLTVSPICGKWNTDFLQQRNIGRRFALAVNFSHGFINLDDDEYRAIMFEASAFTNGPLLQPI